MLPTHRILRWQVLGGQEQSDSGAVSSPKATVVTYVEQDPLFAEDVTVREAVFGGDNPLMRYRGLSCFAVGSVACSSVTFATFASRYGCRDANPAAQMTLRVRSASHVSYATHNLWLYT